MNDNKKKAIFLKLSERPESGKKISEYLKSCEDLRAALKTHQIRLTDVEELFIDLKTTCAYSEDLEEIKYALNPRYDKTNRLDTVWASYTSLKKKRELLNDCCDWPKNKTPLERFIRYHDKDVVMKTPPFSAEEPKNASYIDLDGSKSALLTAEATNWLYWLLWGVERYCKVKQNEDVCNKYVYSADTMNNCKEIFDRVVVYLQKSSYIRTKEDSEALKFMDDILDDKQNSPMKSIIEQLNMLAFLTHTIGNFIPVGGEFNSKRRSKTADYWDLTLMLLRDYYLDNGNCNTYIFNNEKDKNAVHGWLNKTTWNEFVRKYFMLPYTEGMTNRNYTVRPFFPSHSLKNTQPQTDKNDKDDELLECLIAMNAGIIARGLQMKAKIYEKLKELNDEKEAKRIWSLMFPDSFKKYSASIKNDA